MNLILFSPEETKSPLPHQDARARHIANHLRRSDHESFDAGLIDGPRGKGWIVKRLPEALVLEFDWESTVSELFPVSLLIGMPRPQTARRILREAAALGVRELHFFSAEKGVDSYGTSRLWNTGEYHRHLVNGAEQAFSTRLPAVRLHTGLATCLGAVPDAADRIALDLYEAEDALSRNSLSGNDALLAVGSERGWSGAERDCLRVAGFRLASLGNRVLRSDTACVSGITLILAKLGHL